MASGWDVVVVGAGIFGLAVAYSCARRGASVLVLDRAGPGAGASGGLVGALSPHVPERWNPKKAFQLEALLAAPDYWAEVGRRTGRDPGYARLGRLQPLTSDAGRVLAEDRAHGAATLWQGRARWRVVTATDLDVPDGWIDPARASHGWVHDTLSGRLAPRQAVAALAAAVVACGGEIRPGWSVEAVSPGRVAGPDGAFHARDIVLAVGALDDTLPPAGLVTGVKGQAALLRAGAGAAPALYDDGLYVVPQPGELVAIGSTSETRFDAPSDTDAGLEALIERARGVVPMLRGAEVVERWAGLRPRAARPDPMLGPLPGLPGLWVANGAFKIGLGLAPKVGEVLADMLEGRAVDLPPTFWAAHHLERAGRARPDAAPRVI